MGFWRRARTPADVRVVVEYTARGVRLVKGRLVAGRLELLAVRGSSDERADQVLSELGRQGWFEQAQIGLLLGPGQREVAIVSRPEVPEADLVEAMRWQMADSLSFPPEEAVVDVLTMDETEPVARQQVIVVAAQRSRLGASLAPLLALRRAAVAWVDVMDCAQRNLVAACSGSESVACLTAHDAHLVFTVSRGRALVYTRVFDLDSEGLTQGTAIERIGMQILRAVDTIERRSPGAGPIQLVLGPTPTQTLGAALGAIADLSGLPVKRLDWRAGLTMTAAFNELIDTEPALLFLLGALMRPFAKEPAHA